MLRTVIVGIALFGGLYYWAQRPESVAVRQARSDATAAHDAAVALLSLSALDWRKGGFGSVALASFAIKNGNNFTIRDPVVECRFQGGSGTEVSKVTNTIYQRVAPGASIRLRDFNLGFVNSQSASMTCGVVDFAA